MTWYQRPSAQLVAFLLLAFMGVAGFYLIDREGSVRRTETCEAFHTLYASERRKIAEDDVRFQSGAYDKLIPSFSTPEIKRLSHLTAMRRFASFDNSELPNYCPQRAWPERVPAGFTP